MFKNSSLFKSPPGPGTPRPGPACRTGVRKKARSGLIGTPTVTKNSLEVNKSDRRLTHRDVSEKGSELDPNEWRQLIVKKIPQQMNGSDCGMFTCKFAEYLSRRARFTFSQSDMPYFRRRMVYEISKNVLLCP